MTESVHRGTGERVPQALQERIVRGIELFSERGDEIKWLAEDRCKVPSASRKGRFHLVVFGEDGERCGCEDFRKNGKEIGACLHTVSALIDLSKHVDYRVEKRHDSRFEQDVYDVVESRAGVERVVGSFFYVGNAYHAVWDLRGWNAEEEAA